MNEKNLRNDKYSNKFIIKMTYDTERKKFFIFNENLLIDWK